ncbi:unnamed protein product [Vicia faba]|uniref:Kinesin motor domain-containing protein n=1 Tax=Vicia faba TaxID=3906 RepID=A0AAV0YP52_VICFA|nr:unnamed protein product [Vicia faba]
MASTQYAFAETFPGPKVRVAAKIRGFSDPDTNFETSRTVNWVLKQWQNSISLGLFGETGFGNAGYFGVSLDHGRILFKGLTQTPVKSIAEFQNLYITACSTDTAATEKEFEPAPKKGFVSARRSHLGLIVHVFEHNRSINGLVSKINFVDMAGYEDARNKSGDASGVAENNKLTSQFTPYGMFVMLRAQMKVVSLFGKVNSHACCRTP